MIDSSFLSSNTHAPNKSKSQCINGHRFTGNGIIKGTFGHCHITRRSRNAFIVELIHSIFLAFATTKDEGSDAMWITESNQSKSIDQVQTRISTFALMHDGCHGGKDCFSNIGIVQLSGFFRQSFGKQIQ